MFILLADDHAVVRRGLREILAGSFPNAHFGESATANAVISEVSERIWSVLVLDINMPGRSGMDVLREVKRLRPLLPVLMLSVQPEEQYAVRCLRAGASGYLNKESAPEELVNAVRRALAGGRYVSTKLAEKLAFDLDRPDSHDPHEQLSDRELEVVRMIAVGRSLTDIARELNLSAKTVSTYRSRTLLKMQMGSNAELTRYALEHKLIE